MELKRCKGKVFIYVYINVLCSCFFLFSVFLLDLIVLDGPKLATVNTQVRGGDEMHTNLQSTDTMELRKAKGWFFLKHFAGG